MTIEQTLLANEMFVYHAQHNVKTKNLRHYCPDASDRRIQEVAAKARLMPEVLTSTLQGKINKSCDALREEALKPSTILTGIDVITGETIKINRPDTPSPWVERVPIGTWIETDKPGVYEAKLDVPSNIRYLTVPPVPINPTSKEQIGEMFKAEVLNTLLSTGQYVDAADYPASPKMEDKQKYSEVAGETIWDIDLKNADIGALGSVEGLLKFYKVDTKLWKVKEFTVNRWEMGAKDSDGNLVSKELGQIKARLVENKVAKSAIDEIELLKADAKLAFPIPPSLFRSHVLDPDYCLELSLPDAHFGKLAWGEETGWGDFDISIAAKRYREAISTLMHRTSHLELSRIAFVLGNDLFNADNKQNLTTRGTPQDTDSRYQRSFLVVRRLVTEAILTLRQRCPIDVVMVSGNHDQLATWHLGDSLECRFDSDPEVTINNQPTLRKHYGWGKTHILWTHGDKENKKNLPLLMARERPDLWASADFHEIHTGHLHKVSSDETMGVVVRVLPSLSGTDAWHSESGYVGNIPCAEGYVYHRKEGLVDIPRFNVLSS